MVWIRGQVAKNKTLCAQHTEGPFCCSRSIRVYSLRARSARGSCGGVEDDTDKMVREQGTGPGFVLKIRWDGAMSSASVAGCLF